MDKTQIELVESSFTLVARNRVEFTGAFYRHLLETHPELRDIFRDTDFDSQQRKLLLALVTIIENLKQPDELEKSLGSLAKMHHDLAVKREYFTMFADSFVQVLAQTSGDTWSDETEGAWRNAFEYIADMMIQIANK